MRRAPAALRAIVRFVASVMLVSGLLMLADAGTTLLWQEPISAALAGRQQAALEDDLDRERELAALDAERLVDIGDLDRRLAELAKRLAGRTEAGDALGEIELPTLNRSYVVVEGTDTADLRKGPGHYPATPLPGQSGSVAVAGHRTTYGAPFRTVDKLRRGDPIRLDMPYGTFTYEVERTEIVPPTRTSVIRPVGHDRLVLSACHPLYSAAKRIIVYARLRGSAPAGEA